MQYLPITHALLIALIAGCGVKEPDSPQVSDGSDSAAGADSAANTGDTAAAGPVDSAPPTDSQTDSGVDSAPPADTQDTAPAAPEHAASFELVDALPCEVDPERDGEFYTVDNCTIYLGRVSGVGSTVHVMLVERGATSKREDAPTVLIETGGSGVTLTSPPGMARYDDENDATHYIQLLNNVGYRTLEIDWYCPPTWRGDVYCGAMPEAVADWMGDPVEDEPTWHGEGWTANLEGTGLPGAGQRSAAIYRWAAERAPGSTCIHGHSGGSGRVIAAIALDGAGELFDGALFTGGPVWSYLPWYCGIDEPEGYIPGWWSVGDLDFEADRYEDTRSCSPKRAAEDETCPQNFTACREKRYDPVMWEDSLQCSGATEALDMEIGAVIGGADVTTAWKQVLQWMGGIQVGDTTCPPMGESTDRDGLILRQGYCADDSESFQGCDGTEASCRAYSCSLWDLPGGRSYDADLADVGHQVMDYPKGAQVAVSVLAEVCPR